MVLLSAPTIFSGMSGAVALMGLCGAVFFGHSIAAKVVLGMTVGLTATVILVFAIVVF